MRAILVRVLITSLFLANFAVDAFSQAPREKKESIEQSPLKGFKPEDLDEFRSYYQAQIDKLVAEKEQLRKIAIQELETLIRNHPKTPSLDKILFRLAELHYEQAAQEYNVALDEHSDSTACCDDDSLADFVNLPPEPIKDFSRSLALFERLIDEVPQSPLVADALYNKGYVLEELGQTEAAFFVYQELAQNFPQSEYVPDALMRMAEYQFNPPNRNIAAAIGIYKQVLNYKESPLYDAALYRLGWAYYTLSDYPEAIAHFTLLVDDVDFVNPLDPERKYHFPAVQDEAIEYIGISFFDFGGADRAAEFFKEIGGRHYGFNVLKKIGDSHMLINEEHYKAIAAYEHLLAIYPESVEAPNIKAKIAEAYREQNDEQMAYVQRAELFNKYKAGGEWWDKVKESRPKDKATDLARKAQLDNINVLLRRAEENNDPQLYSQAINDSRDYLKAFPDDSTSAIVHWNMALVQDGKLGTKEQAFEEYIKISNTYWGSKYQKLAAENAIALMDEVLNSDSLSLEAMASQDSLNHSNLIEEFSPEEEKLIFALDNYIKLFPHETETSKMLAKAGALYYNHHDFKKSLQYFKTLAKHFPDSESANQARFTIMESYFGKGDYKSTEIIAKRIKDLGPEFSDKAIKRLAESIFFQAKTHAENGDHLKAAEEYRRVIAEAPKAEFADVALYNSGLEFDKAKEHEKAIQSYKALMQAHPKSEHYLSAINNLAFDYRELEDFRNAAQTYERLADIDTTKSSAQVALFNASVSYVQAQDWSRAIQVNSKFVERFPKAEDADDLLFNNAQYYLKLNNLQKANEIYESFARKYPDSPKAVEAFYHRGMYFADNNRVYEAKLEFDKAIKKNDQLKKGGRESNDFYTSEALFQLAEIKFIEFEDIEFKLPPKVLAEAKTKKKALLTELVDSYTRVVGFGTIRLYESTYRIGNAYENFARSWAKQEIPPMSESKRIVAKKEINQTAAGLYDKAVDAYKSGAKALEKFAAKQQNMEREKDEADANRLSVGDSTLVVAQSWIASCKNKVSENLFAIAETYNESLEQLLNAPTPPGMKLLEQLVYRQQVLEKAVAPITKQLVDAHARNLNQSQGLQIENEWTELSREKILRVSTIVPDELQKLSKQALASYRDKARSYEQMVEADDEAAFNLAEELANFVELGVSYASSAAVSYSQNVERSGKMALDDFSVEKAKEKFIQSILDFGDTAEALAVHANANVKKYEKLFAETGNPSYEDAQFTYDDIYFSLADGSQKILKFGYETAEKLELDDSSLMRIASLLVKTDPQKYAEKLGFKVARQVIPSSSSWVVSSEYEEGWTELNFADSNWSAAYNEGFGKNLTSSEAAVQAIWLTNFDESQIYGSESKNPYRSASARDSISVDDLTKAVSRPATVFFRKAFDIEGLPVSGSIKLFADDTYKLFVNGETISESPANADNNPSVQSHSLTKYLQSGKNVIAIEVSDSDNSVGNLELVIEIKHLPELKGSED